MQVIQEVDSLIRVFACSSDRRFVEWPAAKGVLHGGRAHSAGASTRDPDPGRLATPVGGEGDNHGHADDSVAGGLVGELLIVDAGPGGQGGDADGGQHLIWGERGGQESEEELRRGDGALPVRPLDDQLRLQGNDTGRVVGGWVGVGQGAA